MGWHASDTGELAFHDVFVPEENLLGSENGGFYLIMANFQWERLLMALGAVGAMQRLLEDTIASLSGNGGGRDTRRAVADMATRLETGRAMTYNALRLFAGGHDAVREVTIAKLKTQRDCFEVADMALQLRGLAGYGQDAGLERAARDARLGPIGGGTDEVMKEILVKQIGL